MQQGRPVMVQSMCGRLVWFPESNFVQICRSQPDVGGELYSSSCFSFTLLSKYCIYHTHRPTGHLVMLSGHSWGETEAGSTQTLPKIKAYGEKKKSPKVCFFSRVVEIRQFSLWYLGSWWQTAPCCRNNPWRKGALGCWGHFTHTARVLYSTGTNQSVNGVASTCSSSAYKKVTFIRYVTSI